MGIKQDIRQVFKPYYLINITLSISYVLLKRLPGVCNYLFAVDECELDGRETEILFFLLIVIMIRTRKAGSVSMVSYLSASFIYGKVANFVLWLYADLALGLLYGATAVLFAFLVPEPTRPISDDKLVYYTGAQALQDEIKLCGSKDQPLLVALYAAWSPACANFAPAFAQLSAEGQLNGIRFGKIDVGRSPEAARQHRVSDASASKQLPTLLLFRGGLEVARRPIVDGRGKPTAFSFTRENIIAAFDLLNVQQKSAEARVEKHAKKD